MTTTPPGGDAHAMRYEIGRMRDVKSITVAQADFLLERLAALEAKLAAERQRSQRLRKALKQADSRVIQYAAEAFTRKTGTLPPLNWFRRAQDAQESNHYTVDGLHPGDLDAAPAGGEGTT